jgi:hypothetical protein
MRGNHTIAFRTNARAILALCRVSVGQDFHTLSLAQVDALLSHADAERYRKPEGATGSRARYYFNRLVRHAR